MPTLEERVTELEMMLKLHIATTANLQRDATGLSDLGAKSFMALSLQLNRLETTVTGHTSQLNRHSAQLDRLEATSKSHTAMHDEHKADLASLKDDVSQILKIVSGQNLQ